MTSHIPCSQRSLHATCAGRPQGRHGCLCQVEGGGWSGMIEFTGQRHTCTRTKFITEAVTKMWRESYQINARGFLETVESPGIPTWLSDHIISSLSPASSAYL